MIKIKFILFGALMGILVALGTKIRHLETRFNDLTSVSNNEAVTIPENQNITLTFINAPESMQDDEWESLGDYKLTAYCPCDKCCGKSDGITASGTNATAGRTIGVDPNVIPYGTEVMINGHVYIAEDTGVIDGNHIDIFFDTHEEALAFGIQTAEVFIKRELN